ncbi:unnamed protein product [Lactuca saligna]|uniref:Uncharacterized protein n=1 Tax=Lactuca saligna TaxID=75948 RepID=A0AA35ZTU3_LACSI|nr:unnamed protein product [Lactuca saligna]
MQSIINEAEKPKKGGQKGPPTPTKKKKIKKEARKPKSPTPSDNEDSQSDSDVHIEGDEPIQNKDTATTSQPDVSQPISTNPEVTTEIPFSVPIPTYFFENVSIPYPTAIVSIPITISPCLPVTLGISQSPPIFTDSTTTPITTVEPLVSINAFDAGIGVSGFTTGHSTQPIFLLRQNDLDMIYGDDEDNFAGFTYSPFNIKTESDDEAHVMRGKLKSLLETLTKEHSANLEKMNKPVEASATVCNNTTEKVDKLITNPRVFMEKFQRSFESNTMKVNEVISSLGSTLKTEKAKLQEVRTGLKTGHDQFNSSISAQISKLQYGLDMKRKIAVVLTIKTEKVKVLTIKHENAEKQVNDLLSENAATKSCIAVKYA